MRARGPVDPLVSIRVAEGLRTWMSGRLPGTVSAYLATADEVDLSSLFLALPGWRWVLPRVEPDQTITFRDRDVPSELSALGVSQPIASGVVTPLHELDMLLVPGLAFDTSGGRLGRGGGHYDRLLSRRRGDAVAVGVTTIDRIVDRVPVEDHDQKVGWIASENGVMECSTKR